MTRFSSRSVIVVGTAAIVAATCIALGLWQLRRLDERRALNAEILERRSEEPIRIDDLSARSAAAPYLRAVAHGFYDVEHEVLWYGRSLDGQAGHLVVTPLLLGDGAILVLRGWVPFDTQSAPVRAAEPTADEVTVRGVLIPDEGDGSVTPDADGIVRALDIRGIASSLPYDVFPIPLQMREQVPPQRVPLPTPVPLPALSEGPHLSYALQWFSFAAIAVVGAAILLRRDRRAATTTP